MKIFFVISCFIILISSSCIDEKTNIENNSNNIHQINQLLVTQNESEFPIYFNKPIKKTSDAVCDIETTFGEIFQMSNHCQRTKGTIMKKYTDFNFYTFTGNNKFTNGHNYYEVFFDDNNKIVNLSYIEKDKIIGNYELYCYQYKQYIIAKIQMFEDSFHTYDTRYSANEPVIMLHDTCSNETILFWFRSDRDINCFEYPLQYLENLTGLIKLKDKLYPERKVVIDGGELLFFMDSFYEENQVNIAFERMYEPMRKYTPNYKGCRISQGYSERLKKAMLTTLTSIDGKTKIKDIIIFLQEEGYKIGDIKPEYDDKNTADKSYKNTPAWLFFGEMYILNRYKYRF